MMKIAVSIFGQLRGDEETWLSIKNFLIDYLQADVFVHSWLTYEDKYYVLKLDNIINNEFESEYAFKWFERQILRQKCIFNNLQKFIDIIKPTNIYLEKQKIFDTKNYFGDNIVKFSDLISYQNSLSQSYSRMKSIDLIQQYENDNNSKYDAIYQIRSDILVNSFIGNIITPGIYSNSLDTIFYGDRNTMIELSKMYIEYSKKLKYDNKPIWFMEYHIHNFIANKKIKLNNVKMPIVGHGIKRIDNIE